MCEHPSFHILFEESVKKKNGTSLIYCKCWTLQPIWASCFWRRNRVSGGFSFCVIVLLSSDIESGWCFCAAGPFHHPGVSSQHQLSELGLPQPPSCHSAVLNTTTFCFQTMGSCGNMCQLSALSSSEMLQSSQQAVACEAHL